MGFIMDFTFASAEEIRRALAARLRAQRLSQEIPQSELAQMAGISLGAVKTLERDGASSLETVIRVAQALGLAATAIHCADGTGRADSASARTATEAFMKKLKVLRRLGRRRVVGHAGR